MPMITKNKNCGPRSTKVLDCWPISVEQFDVGTQDHITNYWTFHQPAEDGDVYTEVLRISVIRL